MVYDVLIASPSDVVPERNAVESAILDWNAANGGLGVSLRPVRWERDSIPIMGISPQEALNEQFVTSCDLGIGIFWSRIGTPTPSAVSGSVEEVELLVSQGKRVFLYFSSRPAPPDADGDQLTKLETFRAQCRTRDLYEEFFDEADLHFRVFKHLSAFIPGFHSARSQEALVQVPAKRGIPIEAVVMEERGRPEFGVSLVGASRRLEAFSPEFRVAQLSGAAIPGFEWQLNALGIAGDWRTVNTMALGRTHFVESLDLSQGVPVAVGDMFFLLRFFWRDRWYHERHRWPLTKLTMVAKNLFDIGDEMLPPAYWAAEQPMEDPP